MDSDYIYRDEVCAVCGSKPRKRTCAGCGGVGMVLTCPHAPVPAHFQKIKSRNYCEECVARQMRGSDAVMDAVGGAIQVGVGLGGVGMVMEGMDGDSMFDI